MGKHNTEKEHKYI